MSLSQWCTASLGRADRLGKLRMRHAPHLALPLVFAARYPQCCRQIDDDVPGGLTFEIEKGRLSFRPTAPYGAEHRREAGDTSKQNWRKYT